MPHASFISDLRRTTLKVYFSLWRWTLEFTWMKVDKRFQGILNILRHGQRLREQRGGVTRYVLL
ncbi:unnamed protein product [Oncorhynchus mykiss]|uniref:SKA complex subunit 1 n=1 Tax=Oncorhynchus mykiss TaxID=8022 RepID=A0A060W3M3_ONCMY|nr:unnamed protein product [Oncorhynchus mykiss]